MPAKGCYWDNAVADSYFSTFKLRLVLDDNRKKLLNLKICRAIWPSGLRETTTEGDVIRRSGT